MPTTYNYISRPYITGLTGTADEQSESPYITLENEQALSRRRFKLKLADVALIGQAALASASSDGSSITINKPVNYVGGGGTTRASSITIEPFGKVAAAAGSWGSEAISTYADFMATIQYRQQPAIEEDFQPGGEFMTMAPSNFQWKSDSVQLLAQEAPGRLITKGVWNVTRHWLPTVPYEYTQLIGKTNTSTVKSVRFDWTFQPGTLTYHSPIIRSYFDYAGRTMFSVTARMLYRFDIDSGGNPAGWNKFFRAAKGYWDTIQLKSGSPTDYTPYGALDFSPVCSYARSDL